MRLDQCSPGKATVTFGSPATPVSGKLPTEGKAGGMKGCSSRSAGAQPGQDGAALVGGRVAGLPAAAAAALVAGDLVGRERLVAAGRGPVVALGAGELFELLQPRGPVVVLEGARLVAQAVLGLLPQLGHEAL